MIIPFPPMVLHQLHKDILLIQDKAMVQEILMPPILPITKILNPVDLHQEVITQVLVEHHPILIQEVVPVHKDNQRNLNGGHNHNSNNHHHSNRDPLEGINIHPGNHRMREDTLETHMDNHHRIGGLHHSRQDNHLHNNRKNGGLVTFR